MRAIREHVAVFEPFDVVFAVDPAGGDDVEGFWGVFYGVGVGGGVDVESAGGFIRGEVFERKVN